MINNYFKIAWRNLIRNKFFSLINILRGTPANWTAISSGLLNPLLEENFAGIESSVRLSYQESVVTYKETFFNETDVLFADSSFLTFFEWPLNQGDTKTALSKAGSMVISREMALKYLGEENPIGKIFRIDNEVQVVITGVFDKAPKYSPVNFDFLIHIDALKTLNPQALNMWGNSSMQSYVQLFPGVDAKQMEIQIPDLVTKTYNVKKRGQAQFLFQNFEDIHLYSKNVRYDNIVRGDVSVVFSFMGIACLVLLLACFNYMNLSTAQSGRRAREIGLRKSIGATRFQIISQFLTEVIILTFISVIISLILVETLMPWFNHLTNKDLSLYNFSPWILGLISITTLLLISLIAGFYPSFVLSSFEPVKVLKGSANLNIEILKTSSVQLRFKQLMVILQLASSIALIIGAIQIREQLQYVRNKDLGHQPEQVLVIENIFDDNMQQRFNN